MIDAFQIGKLDQQYFLLIRRDFPGIDLDHQFLGGNISYFCSVPLEWIDDLPSAGLIAIQMQGFLLREMSAFPASGEEAAIDEWIRKFKEEYNAASTPLDRNRPDI